MDKQQLLNYCLTKLGAVHDYKQEWGADRVCVAHKMFALVSDLHERPIISLKCRPELAEKLRDQYVDIIPGYYLNKAHWNTLYIDGTLSKELLFELIDESYQQVLNGLPKKTVQLLQAGSK